ncbi:hypothetical protein MesoLj113a_52160 [Mesorhizobium sp. 113-1-2]|uniref:hypothetical protein n=1 Tax=Mesorhizobium sp. 113-1-2 TaxID=2744515 RepID=UPI001928285E|nr:hypothetical protein [Mesorhizobium sp. 113-1-2]BCG74058.1 hypothetical protein MesoLj113a_52160 [Mesorhizobium sp. 113-1-2]
MANDKLWDEVNKSEATSSAQLSLFLDRVEDVPSFVQFIDALRKDREDADRKEAMQSAGPYTSWNGWQSSSISTFLESGVAWAETKPAHLADENPWKAAARILYAGKYYE